MRLLLADDHHLVRDALTTFLERLATEVIPAAAFDEAYALAGADPALDAIILDLRMPGMNGLDGLGRMRALRPDVPVLILSGVARGDEVRDALAAGARGFLPKTLPAAALFSAIKLVLAGETFVPLSLLDNSAAPPAAPPAPDPVPTPQNGAIGADATVASAPKIVLSRRETEVLHYLELGWSNKQIARLLNLHEATVKLHVRGVCRKLGVKNRTQAAMKGKGLGLSP